MSTNNPKVLFQVNHGSGWQTIAETEIINGVVNPPNAWTMVRALQKRIMYTGSLPVEVTAFPDNPRDTHFAGFARALYSELLANASTLRTKFPYFGPDDVEPFESSQRQIIACRVYDLIVHILMHAPTSSLQHCCSRLEAESCIESIPDLANLSKEVQE